MTTVLFNGSLDGATALRPMSSARRQLPVPLGSSPVCPHKTFLPQKTPDKTSESRGISVEVEMEKQVKVEMVKQVKVNCAVQESCESSSAGTVLPSGLSKVLNSGSVQGSQSPALNRMTPRLIHPSSKVSASSVKVPVAQSETSTAASRHKDKPDADRSGANSAPVVGVQYTIRKGIPRQLPNADLIKRANQKEAARGKSPTRSLMSEDSQAPPRPFGGKAAESGKSLVKTSNIGQKLGLVASAASRIAKATVTVETSPSNSASSSATTQSLVKRPLRYGQPSASSTPRPERRSLSRGSVKKNNPESNSLSTETKPQSPGGNLNPEKPGKSTGKGPTKLSTIDRGLKKLENLRNIFPRKTHGLLSIVGKDSNSSSRRTSNSSISCASRIENAAKNNSLIQNSQPSENTETDIVKIGNSEDIANKPFANQPDVVSNSFQREIPMKKVHQLEICCKDLKKQLKVSISELKSRTTAFVATAVVAKHVSEQADLLSKTISDLRSQLTVSLSKCDTLALQRSALIAEIQGLKEDHEVEVNGMTITHQMELHALQEKLKALVLEVEEGHLLLLKAAQSESKLTIEELKSQHAKELEIKDSEFSQTLTDVELKFKQKIAEQQRSQESRFKELKTQFETVKIALVEKIDHLNSECSELRHQNRILADGNPSLMNSFGSNEAEKQVETLTQEIESLKIVLELRNQEIGKLRAQNVIQETQLQELTEAKQRIHQLKLKLENTEAIIHMKSDYERELAEKHTTLLRRYSKESKVNKRLSMNNEELLWKLEQVANPPSTSPKPIRRTHSSGPPTKSAPGTPLLVRRSQPDMDWASFSSDTGVLPGTEDSDLDSVIFE